MSATSYTAAANRIKGWFSTPGTQLTVANVNRRWLRTPSVSAVGGFAANQSSAESSVANLPAQ